MIFDTSQELFSFAKVDEGTKELLNSLRKNSMVQYKRILDLGCGYGAVGLFLKKSFPNSEVTCIDRDSLAIEFTKHNAELNNVEVDAITSLDFENIKNKFDLILCNFPAKLEKEGLEYFVLKSSQHLKKNGILALVVVKELSDSAEEVLTTNEEIKIDYNKKTNNYSVFHIQFNSKLEFNGESYYSNSLEYQIEEKSFTLKTTNSLQEFDTPHFITELLFEKISQIKISQKDITILAPNQGFTSLAVLHFLSPKKINLFSKDLLQLKISKENLELNNFKEVEAVNTDFPKNKSDLLIWSIYDEDAKEICEKLGVFRKNHKKIILGARTQIIRRVLKNLGLEISNETSKGKYSCILF